METIGKKIRDARTKKGLTQSDLASLLNVSRSSVAHWESGAHLPDAEMLLTLSKALDCDFLEEESANAREETAPAAPDPILQEQAPEERQDQPETPEQPAKKTKRNRMIIAAAVAAVLIVGVLLAVFLPRGGAGGEDKATNADRKYRVEDFQVTTPRTEGLPYIGFEVKDGVKQGDNARYWMYDIIIREENGFPFTVDRTENVWFMSDSTAYDHVRTAGDFTASDFDPEFSPYGDRVYTGGFRLPQPKIRSVGFRVFGHAADGTLLSFATWFPFTVK